MKQLGILMCFLFFSCITRSEQLSLSIDFDLDGHRDVLLLTQDATMLIDSNGKGIKLPNMDETGYYVFDIRRINKRAFQVHYGSNTNTTTNN